MSLKEQIESVIKKLPHSESRVPYTYHHDYLRLHVFKEASRANIAAKKCWSEEELYATALIGLLESATYLLTLSNEELDICRQAYQVCLAYIERLQKEPTKKAFVICRNDSPEAVVLGEDETLAEEEKEKLARRAYDESDGSLSYEDYRDCVFWHIHEVKVI